MAARCTNGKFAQIRIKFPANFEKNFLFFFVFKLEPHKNLVDQCVKGEGLVQINLQVRTDSRKINIVDVLKPTDEALGLSKSSFSLNWIFFLNRKIFTAELGHLSEEQNHTTEIRPTETPASKTEAALDEPVPTVDPADLLELPEPSPETNEPIDISDKVTTELIEDNEINVKKEPAKWVIDTNFKKDLARLRISDDPKEWYFFDSANLLFNTFFLNKFFSFLGLWHK